MTIFKSRRRAAKGPRVSRLLSLWMPCLVLGACTKDCSTAVVTTHEGPSAAQTLPATSTQPPSPSGSVSPAAAPKRLVFLGDSLTSGYGLAESESYPSQVQRLIDSAKLDWQVTNAGVSGDTSQGGLERLEWVLQTKPDLLFVCLGANDGLRGLAPELTEKNLSSIIKQVQAKGIPVVMAGMRMPANYGPERSAQYEAVFVRVSRALSVPFLPFLIDGVALQPGLNQYDGIHPNAKGAAIIASRVFEFVRPFLGPSTESRAANDGSR